MRTPLTDVCYTSLFESKDNIAVHMGPAGTGKTETVKDFCKYLGLECIVWNCSSDCK